MPPASGKEKLQIGRRGELLVQSRLLRYGIESSAMTLDYGIDLIALRMGHDNQIAPVSIQVKTTTKLYDKDGDQECYWWDFPKRELPADLIAFVAAEDEMPERIWLFNYAELRKKTGSSFALYTGNKAVKNIEDGKKRRKPRRHWTMKQCKSHLLENLEDKLSPPASPSK